MTPTRRAFNGLAAPALGLATVLAAFAVLEGLIRTGALNRFVVPLPSTTCPSASRRANSSR